ncbi:hypothetical protein LXA43DRAFT_132191 [Ganoderma leucocontextum]|nr:hypothetical protein LXA43DRAFT_132191 [Ganoderma leucocontextum]
MTDVSAILADAHELDDALQDSFVALETIASRLLDRGRIEGALATLNDNSFSRFTHEVQNRFPRTAQRYIGSIHYALLSSLAANLPDAIPASKGELIGRLNECWRAVVLARPVLSEITILYLKITWNRADVRAKPFSDIGVAVPSTPRELSTLEGDILHDQEGVLKYFLEVLRGPARVDVLSRQRELRARQPELDVHPPSGSTVDSGVMVAPEVGPPTGASHTVPQTGEMATESQVSNIPRAAFYLENVKGFGEWEVFVTEHAKADLRKLRKDSKDIFLMVMKKIRDLSRGHFSADNQVPITDTEKAVPIFKARVGGTHRLVYQVDCVSDPTSGDAYQALRIFGVYDHAELHRMGKFWEAVSRDLGRQGKTYRDRCRARSQPRRTANDVFDPIKFYQPMDDWRGAELTESTALVKLEDKDYQMMLSMHRLVTFSKALLNSFLSGRNIAFMYRPSPAEAEIIEHPHSCYVIGRSGTGKTLTLIYKIVSVERAWWTSSWDLPKPRQLFVTRSGMLSRQVQRTVNQILESFKLANLTQEELVDIWRSQVQPAEQCRPLPMKWSELEDGHFPLLISFDELRDLLEADFAESGLLRIRTTEEDGEFDDAEASFVSARRFVATYWNHFPRNLVKGLDPASVFGEIMGVIKGSEGTVNTPRGHLDREVYIRLSPRSQPTFAAMRDRVYDIFERYLSLKRRRNERDDADRTHELLSLLKANGLPGRPVELLFNDEAQDNLIVDMLLLRSLCNNPNGLCWAGDTAQTIALGSSFKFSELTSMIYRVEKSNLNPDDSQIPPRMFHLPVNYRSHAGIISCAQTVVDLLTTLWPESIDRLSPDQGWRRGPKPKFVKRSGFQELFQFSRTDSVDVRESEFSSEQCIIVRDEVSRKALFPHGMPGGQVMTVYQSKGLEFNDVFLWHFFENSEPSEREWQSVCELFRGNPMQSHKTMDQYRNVCRELKALYVAITRARNRLYIIEDSSKSDPMLTLWTEQGQVEVTDASIPIDVPQEPDTEGWAKQGRIHMDKQNFEQAEYAFQRAGRERERRIAHAHLDCEVAVTEEQFQTVALSFEGCATLSLDMPDHKELVVFAAVCYSRARAFTNSARLYYSVSEYTKCTQQYCKASMMEDARKVILEHKNDIDEFVVKRVCVYFLDRREYRPVEELFSDQEDLIEFMKRHNLQTNLAEYFKSLGRFLEAAEVYLDLNNFPKAIKLFFRDDQATSVARGTARLLGELWRRYTLGQPVDKGSKDFKKLNDLLSCRKGLLDRHPLPPLEESEIRMLLLIISRRSDDLLELGNKLRADGHRGFALLSFDYALMFLLEEGPLETVQRMVDDFTILHVFRAYTALVKSHRDEARTSQVFGIDKGRSDSYILLKGTLLYESAHVEKGHDVLVIAGTDGLTIKQSALLRLLRRTLDNRLHSRFSLLGKACNKFAIFQPCISYCLSGDCIDNSCHWKHRGGPHPHPLDEQEIHRRIHLVCQVIVTYGILDASTKAHSVWDARTDWMYLLSNSLHVPFFALGTPVMFHSRLVPKFSEACRVVNTWIGEILYSSPAHSIPSPEIRSRAIPCAALLGYMLNNLRDRLQITSFFAPLEAWYYYGRSYRNHLQHLRNYVQDGEPACSQMPGALLYLRFLLDGRSQGREAIITHIAEGLAMAFILAKSVSDHRALHNIVLGRGWLGTLVDLWNSPVMPPSHDEGHVEDFIKLLYPLLRMLCTWPTGPAGLLLPSEDLLSNEISRVVIAWFLVGYSLELPEQIRSFIVNTIKRIPERLRPLHLQRIVYGSRASCASYVNHARKTLFHAESGWDDLEHAVWCSNGPATNPNPAGQLIHVQKEGLMDEYPMDTPGTVVPITYKGLNSLLPLLSIRSPPFPPTPFPPEWRLPKPRPVPVRSNKSVVRPTPVPCFGGQLRPQMV